MTGQPSGWGSDFIHWRRRWVSPWTIFEIFEIAVGDFLAKSVVLFDINNVSMGL